MQIVIPEFCLVLLVGPSGSGKSTFAAEHFRDTEVISSDRCRALVSDDENSLDATADAFDLLHFMAAKRLKRRRLVVIDATNVQPESRRSLVNLAREYHCFAIAIVFDIPEEICRARNRMRQDRDFPSHVLRNQISQMGRSLKRLKKEGIRSIWRLSSEEGVAAVTIVRQKLWTDRRDERGPFDIVGDLHGCCTELEALLTTLGYESRPADAADINAKYLGYPGSWYHPDGRKAVFLGDLVDRGPRNLDVLFLVRNMVAAGNAICVPGNHDVKLLRKLWGKNVAVKHGLEKTLAEVEGLPESDRSAAVDDMVAFIDSLISHFELDGGKLVVAHAGMKEEMQGRSSGRVREFALYGETTGESDEFGLPVRLDWASHYRGNSRVVYGHTPVPEAEWLNGTINIDTGCVFGGKLTALRYPELELVSEPAVRMYSEPIRPLTPATADGLSVQQQQNRLLDAGDFLGKQIVETELGGRITIRAENGAAALEVMSRFAIDPRWLIYLPPTMAPVGTSSDGEFLERPDEAFQYFRRQNVEQVICEEKHMGSRAVVVLCRTVESAHRRFGIASEEGGVIYTRTGRRFFPEGRFEAEILGSVRMAFEANGFWDDFQTDWVCLDCELMPWSEKAQLLLQDQYAAVGAAAEHAVERAIELTRTAERSGLPVQPLLGDLHRRREATAAYRTAYRHYCWNVRNVEDLRIAPFHILATEGKVHRDRDHGWHLSTIDRYASGLILHRKTKRIVVNLKSDEAVNEGVIWWESLTGEGGEGMVVKPLDFIPPENGPRLKTQPAVKVRGREYLRIIYGPEYTLPENLSRLRDRHLGRKRSLALREFALGIESLERFVREEPLYRVHQAVFGVLALESEPVDPRL